MATGDDYETHSEEYLEKQKRLVNEDLKERHAKLILDYADNREGKISESTARNYLRELRNMIQVSYDHYRVEGEPEDWKHTDWNKLIERTSNNRGLQEGSKRNTCFAVKNFTKWLSTIEEIPVDRDKITNPGISHTKINENDVLTPENVNEIINATDRIRDKAILALMYEGALRRQALCQLDVKHYKTERFTRIKIPVDKKGVKTGHGRERPISWSSAYLDRWINNHHPDPENGDAPLFCSVRPQDNGKRLSGHSIYTLLKRISERSDFEDIDDDQIHPHMFRHARATALRKRQGENKDLNKSDIEVIMGWTDGTPMHSRYEHIGDDEAAKITAQKLGMDIEEDDEEEVLIDTCPRCDRDLPPGNYNHCPHCTGKISEEPAEWYTLYKKVTPEEDPIRKKFKGKTTAVPGIQKLEAQDLDHIEGILILASMDHQGGTDRLDEPFASVEAFEAAEDASRASAIIRNEIHPRLAEIKEDRPEDLELLGDSIDLGHVEDVAEQLSADD